MDKEERLIAFLYLLLRDELPAGKVERILSELPDRQPVFLCPHTEAKARSVATRILGNEPDITCAGCAGKTLHHTWGTMALTDIEFCEWVRLRMGDESG